ncbi:LOW QUALITY PROTEIN: hypothetical protein ElyMa_004786900 [Elysia marginata]|uniref:Uncharacterized protein n=1 Tax=Elysia marginata TaxID=1093978 RepID=A0AAV4IIR5_9GAST|nr:LOW QUALITY PROTEIN: hypothetical protein ElyMa_004786900 [Elysia marginata]
MEFFGNINTCRHYSLEKLMLHGKVEGRRVVVVVVVAVVIVLAIAVAVAVAVPLKVIVVLVVVGIEMSAVLWAKEKRNGATPD